MSVSSERGTKTRRTPDRTCSRLPTAWAATRPARWPARPPSRRSLRSTRRIPGPDLVGALADAVATANLRLQELIISDPAIEGMGTTLTALLWSDGYAALCHIGDSRAYLLRDGQFVQITHDHTLVQSLVDEGKITEDDVATHPHRSLLLRALDGRTIAEPDLAPLETYPGDRYLLCSDGLSGVVTEQTLHQTLASIRDPDKAALQLVELAIKGGGPDNITCHRGRRHRHPQRPGTADLAARVRRRGGQRRADRPAPVRQAELARDAGHAAQPDRAAADRAGRADDRRLVRRATVTATPGRSTRSRSTRAHRPDSSGPTGPANRDGRIRDTAAFDQVNGFTGPGQRPRRGGGRRPAKAARAATGPGAPTTTRTTITGGAASAGGRSCRRRSCSSCC